MSNKTITDEHLTIEVPQRVSYIAIRDILVGAFECNSMTAAWARFDSQEDLCFGPTVSREQFAKGGEYYHLVEDERANSLGDGNDWVYPLHFGLALVGGSSGVYVTEYDEVDDSVVSRNRLDLDSIKAGLALMAEKWPHHMTDFVSGNWDACTADVFLQCCLLKDVVYG